MDIFSTKEWREYLKSRWSKLPKKGRGQAMKLAEYLGIQTSLVSQILSGKKAFTPEQAAMTAEFLFLNENESEYFCLCVQLERAGNPSLQRILKKRLHQIREESLSSKSRVRKDRELNEEQMAEFYSNWSYSAVRQATAIKGYHHQESIERGLQIPVKELQKIIQFLLANGLIEEKNGRFQVGPAMTHMDWSAPWYNGNHRSWRVKGMEMMDKKNSKDFFYTAPMTLSLADGDKVRHLLAKLVEDLDKIVGPSPSEQLICLNLDYFRLL